MSINMNQLEKNTGQIVDFGCVRNHEHRIQMQ